MQLTELEVPTGGYDLVASLGRKCQPAGRLKRSGLRTSSGPFDWFASQNLAEVVKIFRDGVDHLFLPDNILVNGTHKDCMDVTVTSTGYRSIHDLLISDCQDGVSEAIAVMKSKIAVRLARLIEDIESADRVLLVRLNANRTGAIILRRFLRQRFPNTEIDILVINEARGESIKNEQYGLQRVFVLSGDNTASGESWLGSDELWRVALSKVSLKTKPVKEAAANESFWKATIRKITKWLKAA